MDAELNAASHEAVKAQQPPRPTYRSFKKKYLKMRHTFREALQQSNELVESEQRTSRVARRLQEQIDQLLELLLDANDSNAVAARFRFDLATPPPERHDQQREGSQAPLTQYEQARYAEAALLDLKTEYRSGHISDREFYDQQQTLYKTILSGQSLACLTEISHSTLESVPLDAIPPELTGEEPLGYLSPSHEEDYLDNLDKFLQAVSKGGRNIPLSYAALTNRERESGHAPRHPLHLGNAPLGQGLIASDLGATSAHNGDQSPLKELNNTTPIPSRTGAHRAAKTDSRMLKTEEVIDENGFIINGAPDEPARGPAKKRKRPGDDDVYRPKSGSSKKRKRPSARASALGSAEISADNTMTSDAQV